MPAPQCTATVTGKHRSPAALGLCPACNPRLATVARPAGAFGPPTLALPEGTDSASLSRAHTEAIVTTSSDRLRELAQVDDERVHTAVVQNSNADAIALQHVAVHAEPGSHVARTIAQHAHTATATLTDLAEGAERLLRESPTIGDGQAPVDKNGVRAVHTLLAVADHRNTSSEVLDAFVRSETHLLIRPPQSAPDEMFVFLKRIARNRNTPMNHVVAMLAYGKRAVREGAAANPGLTPEHINDLVHDERATVRRVIANSKLLTDEQFGHLSLDTSSTVRTHLANNRAAPEWVLKRLATDANYTVMLKVIANPSSTLSVLAAAYHSPMDELKVASNAVLKRFAERGIPELDIDPRNTNAIETILGYDWGNLTPDSPEVLLTKITHPNP